MTPATPSSRLVFPTTCSLLAAVLGWCSPEVLAGGNLLANPSFEIAGPLGPEVVSIGYGGVGHSAAEGWGVFHNTDGTTKTRLVSSEVPDGGDLMLHVITDGFANGVSQVFGPFGGGWACVQEQITVWVVSGTVIIGAGNGGNTGPNAFSQGGGTYEVMTADNAICPANTFIIYSWSLEGAEFYVDLASVKPFSCQGPPGDLNLDGIVDGADLGLMLGAWGPCAACLADLNGSGNVDGSDLGSLLSNWGECNPAP